MFLCSILTALAQFSGSGNGTEKSPYLIFNVTQLSQISNFGGQSGIVFRLMKVGLSVRKPYRKHQAT